MTVLEVLQSMTAYFKKRNIDNPRLNAEHLLAHVLERTRMELYLEFERNLGETELAAIRDMLRAMLLIPGAAIASVSAYGHMGGVQEVAARSTPAEEALNLLQSKLNLWLRTASRIPGINPSDVQIVQVRARGLSTNYPQGEIVDKLS